nr:S41 family peptidase [Acidobacteriota bacterium]
SKNPMIWNGRIYFLSDRDGTMNLWSLTGDGKDLRQHSARAWDIAEASLDGGRIAFRSGADLFLYDLATGTETPLAVTLGSDLDQTRERTIKDPLSWTTSAHLAPDGQRVVLTARGQVFVAPAGPGRFVEASRRPGVRFRDGRFLADGKTLLALADESGEVELWTLPANGVGDARQISRDGEVLRWTAIPSPDGLRVAHTDKNQRLWLTELASGASRKLDENAIGDIEELAWSPDGRWLAASAPGDNLNRRVKLYPAQTVAAGDALFATTDRYDSSSPVFSADGKWLVLLSERHLESLVPGPWGLMQPEPFFDKTTRIYLLPLTPGLRSPFEPPDELHPAGEKKDGADDKAKSEDKKRDEKQKDEKKKDAPPSTAITAGGLAERLVETPVPPGNYRGLFVTEKALFWLSSATGERGKADLQALEITNEKPEVKTVLAGVAWAEPSADGKKILARKDDALYVFDAAAAPVSDLDKKKVDLSAFTLSVDPREEWRQMFVEAWRLERDYFYDRAMHGVDWNAMRARYQPLVERVRSRGELSDLLAQMVSEVEALHTFVYGGDARKGDGEPDPAFLGARLARDAAAGGLRVESIYRSDPDRPELTSPLARPGVDVKPGDVILAIDGVATLSATDPGALLRAKAGRQVLLSVRPASGGAAREVIVRPLTPDEDGDRRYHEWEYTRRLATDEAGGGAIGYVHLRAMGGDDYSSWARDYYPVFTRQGLIVDVRHNRGGNIDSWILSRLLRRAWSYWNQRVGRAPSWNMQYAFRGHVVVLVDQFTASDGEAFAEGFRRLGLGPVIGTRTWGGEIWLTSSNVLVDRGIATAAEFGLFGPEGSWLIEGHGVEPDIVVDNLPRATFEGKDAQLEAAIRWLQDKIAADPRPIPPVPPLPRKGPPAR